MVDGAPSDNVLNLAPDGDGTPSIEFLGEFKILSHDYGAEFGRALGSVINVTTKSGTNQLHGEAYEFLRNKDLSARPFFSAVDGENTQNQFGANIGGAIKHNRTFFFGGWESSRQRNANSGSSTIAAVVPTLAQRAGNFGSKTDCRSGHGYSLSRTTRFPPASSRATALALQKQGDSAAELQLRRRNELLCGAGGSHRHQPVHHPHRPPAQRQELAVGPLVRQL